MHRLISDCYEQMKQTGQISAEEADPVIEWGYKTLFEEYADSSRRGEVQNAALKLGKICLAREEPVSACLYFNWFMDNAFEHDGRLPEITRILEQMEGCGR